MQATIELRLFATLAAYAPTNAARYPIEAGTSIGQLLDQIQIPTPDAKLIFVNSVRAELDTKLKSGDQVGIFPPVGGG